MDPGINVRFTADKQKLEAVQKHQKELDKAISDVAAKIKASEGQLYGGTVRNPKELSSIQADVKQMKAKRTEHEDQLLAVMDQLEQAQKDIDASSARLIDAEAGWKADQVRLVSEIADLKARVAVVAELSKSAPDLADKQAAATSRAA